MSDDFNYRCRPRPACRRSVMEKQLLGAGSGGDGDSIHMFDGYYYLAAGTLVMNACGEKGDDAGPPWMSLIAGDEEAKGFVTVRGGKGVRLTSGPPGQPPDIHHSINGLEMQTGDDQFILIARGMDDNPAQGRISLLADGIGINGNQGGVWVKSLTKIKLAVAGGTSYIELTPSGIVMKGPLIQIN